MIRGIIYNRERANQRLDFSGLRIGKITAQDIDWPPCMGAWEKAGKWFIFGEWKYDGAPFHPGQRYYWQNLARAFKPEIGLLFFVADHYVHDVKQDVPAHLSIIREYYYRGQWFVPETPTTVLELVNEFRSKYDDKKEETNFGI